MSLQVLPSGNVKVRWRVGTIHKSKTFTPALEPNPRKRRKMAEDYLRERRREVALGVPQLASSKLTLTEVVADFIPQVVKQKAPKTQTLYR